MSINFYSFSFVENLLSWFSHCRNEYLYRQILYTGPQWLQIQKLPWGTWNLTNPKSPWGTCFLNHPVYYLIEFKFLNIQAKDSRFHVVPLFASATSLAAHVTCDLGYQIETGVHCEGDASILLSHPCRWNTFKSEELSKRRETLKESEGRFFFFIIFFF